MTIDEFLAMAGIPNTGSGEYVSAGTAESLPAVMNAVSVISEAVATMPCYGVDRYEMLYVTPLNCVYTRVYPLKKRKTKKHSKSLR